MELRKLIKTAKNNLFPSLFLLSLLMISIMIMIRPFGIAVSKSPTDVYHWISSLLCYISPMLLVICIYNFLKKRVNEIEWISLRVIAIIVPSVYLTLIMFLEDANELLLIKKIMGLMGEKTSSKIVDMITNIYLIDFDGIEFRIGFFILVVIVILIIMFLSLRGLKRTLGQGK